MYVDTVFGFHGYFIFNCLVGCLSMIAWTPAALGVLYACVLYLHLFGAIEHVSHGKALYKCALYYYYYYCYYYYRLSNCSSCNLHVVVYWICWRCKESRFKPEPADRSLFSLRVTA